MGRPRLKFSPSSIADIEEQIRQLSRQNIHELRQLWLEVHKKRPSDCFGRDLLIRSIVYVWREQVHGGLDAATHKVLQSALQPKKAAVYPPPRKLQVGTVLVREWKDKLHRIMVVDEGYAWQGKVYPSLSKIARLITGTNWNGPGFFGLNKKPRPKTQPLKEACHGL